MKESIKGIIIWGLVILTVGIGAFISMQENKEKEGQAIVGIHIKGEVQNPGYYEFSYGSRIKDAIEKAGGKTENADVDKINLAQRLRDGEEIVIPTKEKEVSVLTDSPVPEENKDTGKVNLNTADVNELCTLDGVGEETASRIIDYRKKNGMFSKIEELKNIGGIGEAKFQKVKDKISV